MNSFLIIIVDRGIRRHPKAKRRLTISSYASLTAISERTPTRGTTVVTGVREDITSIHWNKTKIYKLYFSDFKVIF